MKYGQAMAGVLTIPQIANISSVIATFAKQEETTKHEVFLC